MLSRPAVSAIPKNDLEDHLRIVFNRYESLELLLVAINPSTHIISPDCIHSLLELINSDFKDILSRLDISQD